MPLLVYFYVKYALINNIDFEMVKFWPERSYKCRKMRHLITHNINTNIKLDLSFLFGI